MRIDETLKRLERRKKAGDKRNAAGGECPGGSGTAQPSLAQMMTEPVPVARRRTRSMLLCLESDTRSHHEHLHGFLYSV